MWLSTRSLSESFQGEALPPTPYPQRGPHAPRKHSMTMCGLLSIFLGILSKQIPTFSHQYVGKESSKTNYIEQLNNTMQKKSLFRQKISFCKKLENHIGASWYFIYGSPIWVVNSFSQRAALDLRRLRKWRESVHTESLCEQFSLSPRRSLSSYSLFTNHLGLLYHYNASLSA